MKRIRHATVSILLLGFILGITACDTETDSGKGLTMYAAAKSGLIIRSEASTESARLGLIPYGSSLTVFEQTGDTITILGQQGRWTRIEFQGTKGWVFGGFLSANAPPALVQRDKCAPFMKCYAECSDLLAGPGYEMCMDDCFPAWVGLQKACEPQINQ